MCNAVLDSQIYNGHTTAGDALWGGCVCAFCACYSYNTFL